MRVEALFAWITERHAIYEAKNAGYPKPWTEDPILRAYRFCNVYRELDKVTQWIAEHWRDNHYDSPEVWFAMTVARLVNWPDTLEELGYPVPFDPMHFIEVLERRKQAKEKVFTGVYIQGEIHRQRSSQSDVVPAQRHHRVRTQPRGLPQAIDEV